MTVCVVKDGVLACDTVVANDATVCGSCRKWVAVPSAKGGGFACTAGCFSAAQSALAKMARGEMTGWKCDCAMWLKADGTVWERFGEGEWYTYDADFYVIGGGEYVAAGALAAGASAAEAVQICIDLHFGCGGSVDVAGSVE